MGLGFISEEIWLNELSLWVLDFDVCNNIISKLKLIWVFIDWYIFEFYSWWIAYMVSQMRIYVYELKCVIDVVNDIYEIIMIRKSNRRVEQGGSKVGISSK